MPRHTPEAETLRVHDGTTLHPVRPSIDFTGAGVSVTDDEVNDQTVVDFAGGATFRSDQWAIFEQAHDPSTVTPFPYYLNLGAIPSSEGPGASIFGSGFHNPASGNLQIAETGLYSVCLQTYQSAAGSASFPAIPVSYRIQTGGRNGGWEGVTGIQYATATAVYLSASINFTTYLAADESLRFLMKRGGSVPTAVSDYALLATITRLL